MFHVCEATSQRILLIGFCVGVREHVQDLVLIWYLSTWPHDANLDIGE